MPSQSQRASVQKLAEQVPNVKQVVNELEVTHQKATASRELTAVRSQAFSRSALIVREAACWSASSECRALHTNASRKTVAQGIVERQDEMARNRDPEKPRALSSSANTIRFASLVLVFITIVALGAVAYFTERGIVVSRDWVIHTYRVRSQLNDLELEVVRAETNAATNFCRAGSSCVSGDQTGLARQTVDELRRLTRITPGSNFASKNSATAG